MSTVTNSRFLTVLAEQPDLNSGWSVHVLDYKNLKSLVAIVSEFTELSFTQELNGTGTGSITLDEDSPFWTQVLNNGNSNRVIENNEYVFEAWENNTPRFAWVGQTVENTLVGEDETRSVVISGPGIAQVLTWASIHRPGWPTKVPDVFVGVSQADGTTRLYLPRFSSYQDTIPALNWRFPIGWPTMRMWYTVFKSAQRRGLLSMVTIMFSALKDSGGKPWVAVKTLDEVELKEGYQPDTPSANLLDFLNDCTGQDYSKWFGQRLEWIMHPGFKLDVRPTIGSDRSSVVRFFQGNVLSDERTRDRENIFNRVISVNVDGDEVTRLDKASVAAWNLREQRNETNKNVTDPTLMGQLADRYIQQSRDEKDQWTIQIPYDDPGRQPYRDFNVGDWIGINVRYLGSTVDARQGPDKYRVMALSISISADSTVPECELTLKSLIDLKQEELQKQITQLINNPRNGDLNNLGDVDTSTTAPKDGDTLVYNGATGKWEPASSGTGGGGGGTMWVSDIDPSLDTNNTISAGDFWLETYQ
jgi:hypothetical protein